MNPPLLRPTPWIALALLAGVAFTAGAQNFPTKPIRFLVPFGPGGVGDITARVVAQKMGDQMGQQIIIDNRPGAGGVVATEIVAKAEPDGHTMLLLNNAHAISTSLFKTLPYDTLRDFAPVGTVGTFSIVLMVSPESPLKSVKDLIAQAKANPGKMNAGSVLLGATQHLSAELFKSMAGIDFTTVPHNTTGALIASLRGGSVQVAFDFIAPVIGQVKSGALRALAISPRNRFPGLPNIPTVAETVPGFVATGWAVLVAPVGTPEAVIRKVSNDLHQVTSQPDLNKKLARLGSYTRPMSFEETTAFVHRQQQMWNPVLKEIVQKQP